jgi:hypothetical protein
MHGCEKKASRKLRRDTGECTPTHAIWKSGQASELDPARMPSLDQGEIVQEQQDGDAAQLKAAAVLGDKKVCYLASSTVILSRAECVVCTALRVP